MSDFTYKSGDGKNKVTPPEGGVTLLAFLCCLAIVGLAFTPGFSSFLKPLTDWPLTLFFCLAMLLIAYGNAIIFNISRRDDLLRFALTQDESALRQTPKKVLGLYASFAILGLVYALTFAQPHPHWPRFILYNVIQFGAYLLLRRLFSRPPSGIAPQVEWLPKQGQVRATPTEIVVAASWQSRALMGCSGLFMAVLAVLYLVVAFGQDLLFGPKHSHDSSLMTMALFAFPCFAIIALVVTGGAGPRDLRLELDSRRYVQTNWQSFGKWGKQGVRIPFRVAHTTGAMDADMAGICVREFRHKGNISYILEIAWRDKTKPAYTINRFRIPEEAQVALAQAADALHLPPLEACP